MKTILAPVDFSAVSQAVVKEAAALARTFDGRVVLLTVVQPPVVDAEYASMMDIARLTAAQEKGAARELETLEDQLKNQFVKTESVRITGAPVSAILKQAEAQDADYIVMGSHGHTAFYDLLVGSTTHGVLKRAKCPVVIVPTSCKASAPTPEKKRSSAAA